MTEQEWLQASDPESMLECLSGKATARKLRLFACACCRRIWHRLTDEWSRQAVDTSERFADGLATKEELMRSWNAARLASYDRQRLAEWAGTENSYYAGQFDYAAHVTVALNLNPMQVLSWAAEGKWFTDAWRAARREESLLLRDIFGNPFRPVSIEYAWLTPDVVAMAKQMYDSREFADMPMLADALEEAGCTDQDILSHCRSGGEHTRGCWVIDLILGRQ